MSNERLAALKALYKKEKAQKENSGNQNFGDTYPFWNMENGQSCEFRFLPDLNEENPFQFYVEKLVHNLIIDGKEERIPCMTLFGEKKCPICEVSKEWYKLEGKGSSNGLQYYKKRSALLRAIVIKDPLPKNEETGLNCEGKQMTIQFTSKLMELLKSQIGSLDDSDPDIYNLKKGFNFTITKKKNGEYSEYITGSGLARHATAIDPDILETLELLDLSTLLPKNPGLDAVNRKLEAHLNGTDEAEESEEDEKVEETKTSTKPEVGSKVTKPSPKKEEEKVEVKEEVATDDDDILAQIRRNRANKNKQ